MRFFRYSKQNTHNKRLLAVVRKTAFTIFAKTVTREKRIPFEVTADPFYCESNMEHLRRGIAALNAGKGVEHECIEVEDE